MPIAIKSATLEDAGTVAALIHRLLSELGDGGRIAAVEDYAEVCRKLLASDDDIFTAFLAYDSAEQPVGVVALSECAAVYARGRFGEITEFYVAPEQRSAGVGQRLLERAMAHGRARGWSRLEVGAPDVPRWARTVDFYKAKGFTEVGPRLKLAL